MCDYSLHHVKSRPAKVGDKLRTVNFNTGTRGFAAPEDSTTAVCVLPGTELAFSEEVKCAFGFSSWRTKTVNFRTAIFRQVNKDVPWVHHDALEFPDGTCVLLTELRGVRRQRCFNFRHSQKRQLRKQPRSASLTWADARRSSGIKPLAAGAAASGDLVAAAYPAEALAGPTGASQSGAKFANLSDAAGSSAASARRCRRDSVSCASPAPQLKREWLAEPTGVITISQIHGSRTDS